MKYLAIISLATLFLLNVSTIHSFVSPIMSPIPSYCVCDEKHCSTIRDDCYTYLRDENKNNPEQLRKSDEIIERTCTIKYDTCLSECGIAPTEKFEVFVDQEIKEEVFVTTIVPLFIQHRRWPLPSSLNPGNTNCTYFTDGTKFCR